MAVADNVGASGHPSYPLGRAKSCKVNYVKRTERRVVKGKVVRYIACVYKVSPTVTTTTSTTTIGVAEYTVSLDSMSDIQERLPVGQVDEVTVLVNAPPGTAEAPRGTASFFVGGKPIAGCQGENLMANMFNGTPPYYEELSTASCNVQFSTTGIFTLSVKVTEPDGATDLGTLGVLVVPKVLLVPISWESDVTA